MLNHVLVPLDGSILAESALEYARQIVNPKGTITLLTVINLPELPVYDFYPTPVAAVQEYEVAIAEAIPRAKEYMQQVANTLHEQMGVEVNTEVISGDPADVIVETADRLKVSAIVMSTHGRSGLSRWLFGSVTNKVLGAAVCPVLVIPNRQRQAANTEAATPEAQSTS